MAHDHGGAKQLIVEQGNGFGPEVVVGVGAERAQPGNHLARSRVETWIGRIAQDADTAVDRDRAGGPSALPVAAEPAVGGFVRGVVWIKQRSQDVYIEKSYAHSPSRNRFTSSEFGFLAPGLGVKRGTPFRVVSRTDGAIAFRIGSEMIWPIVARRWRAKSLAACTRSSSISRVVLTILVYINHQPIR